MSSECRVRHTKVTGDFRKRQRTSVDLLLPTGNIDEGFERAYRELREARPRLCERALYRKPRLISQQPLKVQKPKEHLEIPFTLRDHIMIVWSRRVDSSLDSKAFVPQNITQSRKLYAFQKGVSALVLNNFFFSRPVAIDAGSVLSKAHEGRQLSDGEDALLDLLAGLPTYPEAHASEHAREMKLGIDNGVVDFLATTANEVEAAGFELSLIAIGPAPDEQGFNLIASLILPEVIQKAKSRGSENQWNAQIIIARIQCSIDYDSGGGLSVEGYPLYGGFDAHARVEMVLRWLTAAVKTRL